MNTLDIRIEGIGFWAPGWPDWNAARAGLRGEAQANPDAAVKPSPSLLAAAERRRAPQAVLLACEVAAQACASSAHAMADLPSVFASTHGELAITDYMCSTLASAPRELSPIRFHNSVHNAPAGYWTIAANCHAASTSISGWYASFATALIEAAVEAIAEDTPVLIVAYDTESVGPLIQVDPSASMFGVAMVIVPAGDAAADVRLRLIPAAESVQEAAELPAAFAQLAANNPMAAGALPLLAALAVGGRASLSLSAGEHSILGVELCA